MTDRLVHSGWWFSLMCLICACGATALITFYCAVLNTLETHWIDASIYALFGAMGAAATWLLCHYRNDVLDA